MIQFHNVYKSYPSGHDALDGVSFRLSKGEMAFLTGHSGAGKSTFLKLISLIERPSKGQILFENVNLRSVSKRKIAYHRRKIGMIFQNNLLLDNRSVFDNVALPLEVSGYRTIEVKKRAQAALDKVGLLHYRRKLPSELSSGEQQRVGIARAISTKPNVILADEPTGNLDPELSSSIMHLFEQFNQVGVTVLIASHDLNLINTMPYRKVVLDQGRIASNQAPLTNE